MALEQEQLFSKEEESILTKHNVVVGDLPDNINRDGIIKNKANIKVNAGIPPICIPLEAPAILKK